MDNSRVALLRELLGTSGWLERTRDFAGALNRSTKTPGGLLLVGTPEHEPWHLAAHLDDESRYAGLPELAPTLVRWQAPPDAPPHLRLTMARLEASRRGETVFIVAPDTAPTSLLERVSDARHAGATILSIDTGDSELGGLAHESLVVRPSGLLVPADAASEAALAGSVAAPGTPLAVPGSPVELSIDSVQHLVSSAAGELAQGGSPARVESRWRDRLNRFLDVVSGPAS